MDRTLERTLLERLAESPRSPSPDMWIAYWGADPDDSRNPRSAGHILQELRTRDETCTVLIYGRYGTGKTSFARMLQERLEPPASDKGAVGASEPTGNGETEPPPAANADAPADRIRNKKIRTVWIPMATAVSRAHVSASAVVLAWICDSLLRRGNAAEQVASEELAALKRATEDFWHLETTTPDRAPLQDAQPGRLLPWQDRMVGHAGSEPSRYTAAMGVEMALQKLLKKSETNLIVFLDDLDRCPQETPMQVVDLLLRFSGRKRVHFVITCDWDVLEQGVRDWMDAKGKRDDGAYLVAPNSALEKYVQYAVELPSMGARLGRGAAFPSAYIDGLEALLRSELPDRSDRTLADLFVATLLGKH